ncbi:MAG TPA: UDP-N-acetylmuramoyl-tripeptide--D-alanyl-D-alanine ligase, partial [Flavobacterium sp.]
DMFELGKEAPLEHKAIVAMLSNEENVTCYFIGKAFYDTRVNKDNFHFYDTFEAFASHLKTTKIENSLLLIKGSRGMALERTLDFLF